VFAFFCLLSFVFCLLMLTPTSAIMGAGLGKECALLTDGE
jgi:hypothetical protein